MLSTDRKLSASVEGKGMCRTGITAFSYFSLQTAAPDAAESIIEAVTAEVEKKKANAPSGIREQWDTQLRALRNEGIPQMELVIVPTYMRASCKTTCFFYYCARLNRRN